MSSIATRTGDDGTTGLFYDRRVPKTHPQVDLGGTIDELSATLTLARAVSEEESLSQEIFAIQQDLVALMAAFALDPQDWEKYAASKMVQFTPAQVERLDRLVEQLEAEGIVFRNWNLPHFTVVGAQLEVARTICRRAERAYWVLLPLWQEQRAYLGHYLNRLADVLWLLARRDGKNS
jgi:cob(I)alamin adenosyltransferase